MYTINLDVLRAVVSRLSPLSGEQELQRALDIAVAAPKVAGAPARTFGYH